MKTGFYAYLCDCDNMQQKFSVIIQSRIDEWVSVGQLKVYGMQFVNTAK